MKQINIKSREHELANANECKISCAWLKTNVDEVESCLVYNYKFEVSNNNYEVMHENNSNI